MWSAYIKKDSGVCYFQTISYLQTKLIWYSLRIIIN